MPTGLYGKLESPRETAGGRPSVNLGDQVVYVIKPDNTVTSRPVKLGSSAHDRVVVKSGLQSGDRVVTEGADRLREGASVSLAAAAAQPGSASAH